MYKTVFLLLILLVFSGCFSALPLDDETIKDNSPFVEPESYGNALIMAHYMPWYRGPSTKSQENNLSVYGGHWTGWGRFNPTEATGGKAQIQARQYPLTGPYHSANTALLEYQAALMKIAGIDGVIFDWYGCYDAFDYGENQEYTEAMVAVLKQAGLKFLVCYEDNTINAIGLNGDEALAAGKMSFDWAQANWFNDSAYICSENRPVVFCFGPQHFDVKTQWDTVFSGTDPQPWFVDLDNRYSWADSSFNWPPMWASANGVLTQARLTQYLDQFYNGAQKNNAFRVSSVFSAFDDAYVTSLGKLAYDNGKIFDLTWRKAAAFKPAIIQIVTWNDYGEGTIIEPTVERGYKELEYIQDRVRKWNPGFPFTKEDMRWPLEFYRLLYTESASAEQTSAINLAINALFEGDTAAFRANAKKTGVSVNVNDLKPLLRN